MLVPGTKVAAGADGRCSLRFCVTVGPQPHGTAAVLELVRGEVPLPQPLGLSGSSPPEARNP